MIPFSKINPVSVRNEYINILSYSFNYILKKHVNDNNNYSPLIKFGFYHNGNTIEEKMFVCEDSDLMVSFVKNVVLNPPNNSIRRSFYMIIRPKVSYIHLSTGYIFDDLIDYAVLENVEFNKYLYIIYNDKYIENPLELYQIDKEFKSKVKIFTRDGNVLFNNNMRDYMKYLPYTSQFFNKEFDTKIAYYIQDKNIQNFHVAYHISECFSPDTMPKDQLVYGVMQNTAYLNTLFETDFTQIGHQKSTKQKRENYVGSSLVRKIKSIGENIQEQKYIIAWFFCEMLFSLFFP